MGRLRGKIAEKKKNLGPIFASENKGSFSQKGKLERINLKKTARKERITKKQKRQRKKETFVKKLADAHEKEQKVKLAKKKAETVIVGNMDVLLDALPEIDPLAAEKKKKAKQEREERLRNKTHKLEKARKEAEMADVALFKQVIAHPKYKADPVHAISDHVKYLIMKEDPI